METLKKKILSSSGSSDGESGNESPSDELEMSDIESIYNGIDSDFEEDSELNNSRRELQGSLRQALKTSLNTSQGKTFIKFKAPSPKNVNLSSPLGVTSTSLEASTSTAIVGHIPPTSDEVVTSTRVIASFKKVKIVSIKYHFNSNAYFKTTNFIVDNEGTVAGGISAILALVYGKYVQANRRTIIEPFSDWNSFITKIRGKCSRTYLRRDTYNITGMSTKLMGKIQIGSNTIKRGVLFAKKIFHFDGGQVKCHPTFLKKLFSKGSDIKTIIDIGETITCDCIANMSKTRPDLSIYRRTRQKNKTQSDDNPAPKKKPRLTKKLLPKKKQAMVSTLSKEGETLITLTDKVETEPELETEVEVEPEVEPEVEVETEVEPEPEIEVEIEVEPVVDLEPEVVVETFSNVNRYNSMVRAIELLNIKIDKEFIDGIKPLICKSAKIDPAQMVTLFAGMLHWRTKNTEDHPTIIISDEEKSLIVNIMNLN